MENENTASVAGGTHTGDRGPYRTGHVLVNGVGVVDVRELMRQHAEMERQLGIEKQQSGWRAEHIVRMHEENASLRRAIVAMDSGWIPAPHLPPQQAEFVQAALEELNHARAKHGDGCIDGDKWSDSQRLSIILEELGEVAKELNDEALGGKPGVEGGHLGRLLGEMVQVGAMAIGWGARLMPGPAAELPAVATEPAPGAPVADGAAAPLWDQPGRVIVTDSEARTEDHYPGRGGW